MSTSSPTPTPIQEQEPNWPIYQNFIGGKWCESKGGETFASTNPAHTREVIGYFQKSIAADVEDAVSAAAAAQPDWAATPPPERGEILLRTALLLEQHKEELAILMTREMGKILKETRGDVQTAIDVAKYMAGEGRRAEGETHSPTFRRGWHHHSLEFPPGNSSLEDVSCPARRQCGCSQTSQ